MRICGFWVLVLGICSRGLLGRCERSALLRGGRSCRSRGRRGGSGGRFLRGVLPLERSGSRLSGFWSLRMRMRSAVWLWCRIAGWGECGRGLGGLGVVLWLRSGLGLFLVLFLLVFLSPLAVMRWITILQYIHLGRLLHL